LQSKAQTTTKDIKTIDVNGVPTIQIPVSKQLIILRGAYLSEVYRTRDKVCTITVKEMNKLLDSVKESKKALEYANDTLLEVIANDSAIIKSKDVIITDQKKKIKKQKIKFIGSWTLAGLGILTYVLLTIL
jgi:hypothetical protein